MASDLTTKEAQKAAGGKENDYDEPDNCAMALKLLTDSSRAGPSTPLL